MSQNLLPKKKQTKKKLPNNVLELLITQTLFLSENVSQIK